MMKKYSLPLSIRGLKSGYTFLGLPKRAGFLSLFWSVFLFITLMFTTCIDPVDFDTTAPGNTLVVEGQFTTGESGNYVYLSRVTEFGKTFRQPVIGATVRVVNEAGNPVTFIESSPGFYSLTDPAISKGITGQQYHLEVTLQDGEKYKTAPETMPPFVPMDSIQMEVSKLSNGKIDIFVSTTFPDFPVWLKYKVQENYAFEEIRCALDIPPKTCYFVLPALYPFYIATNDNNSASRLDHFKIGTKTRLTTPEFSRGRHYFSVDQYSSTEKAYIYFAKLNKLLSLNGSVFDAPPAPIPGNLYNENDSNETTLGYFELAAVDTLRTFAYPSLIRQHIYLPDFCDPQSYYTYYIPVECCDCLTFPGATLTKPNWWQ